jgi:hypothetical protein
MYGFGSHMLVTKWLYGNIFMLEYITLYHKQEMHTIIMHPLSHCQVGKLTCVSHHNLEIFWSYHYSIIDMHPYFQPFCNVM